jgi:ribosomal protein L37AE/L43A
MNGLILQQSSCPRCGILRTVRVGTSGLTFCMNCRHRWAHGSIDSARKLDREDRYAFTPAELQRLEVYRRAIAVGFYAG